VSSTAAQTATGYQRTFGARADQLSQVRRDIAGYLGGCPVTQDMVLIADEMAANAILFFLLNSCVAIAAIGEQVDLRPVLSDYLFLAADCCGACETGQPPRSAGQLRHGCHRTRRLRKEILHTHSRGSTFGVRCQLSAGAARIEVEDMGGPWRPRPPDDRPHGLDIIQALTGPDGWGTRPTGTGGRITWAQLSW
jgi:hypothetical protein